MRGTYRRAGTASVALFFTPPTWGRPRAKEKKGGTEKRWRDRFGWRLRSRTRVRTLHQTSAEQTQRAVSRIMDYDWMLFSDLDRLGRMCPFTVVAVGTHTDCCRPCFCFFRRCHTRAYLRPTLSWIATSEDTVARDRQQPASSEGCTYLVCALVATRKNTHKKRGKRQTKGHPRPAGGESIRLREGKKGRLRDRSQLWR